ncbi:hypothetical protein SEUCBS139899_002913 [Sporothrix eucalyptigena]|uniref:hydroxymethylglutaryl-CoA lyase n=1 Tax=Sporothrix eucalyptigena TaxID=1812306 RepID=A0ABP0D144_9PEZI
MTSRLPSTVRIVEVGPRDGLQNIPDRVPTATKIELIQRLIAAGLTTIEVTSVVSPNAVPQLADCHDVLTNPSINQLLLDKSRRTPVLVPNLKGAEIASQAGVNEVAVFVSATEGFSRANTRCSVEEGLKRACDVTKLFLTRPGTAVRGYISCIFADPFDGPTEPTAVVRVAKALLEAGCYEVSLGDTLGVGTPHNVRQLIGVLKLHGIPLHKLAGHFHDTYGQALANVWEAYRNGIQVFDASVAGLGGCPFAPGAKGNASTEDVVYMFLKAGISTGVDLDKLVDTGVWISEALGKPSSSRAGVALASARGGPRKAKPQTKPITWVEDAQQSTPGLAAHRAGVNFRVTMDRPKNGNALTTEMIENLTTLIRRVGTDDSVKRVILTGAGRFFCTGMDLSKGSTPVGVSSSTTDAQYERLTGLLNAINTCPKTTIACLNGPAFGGGVGIAFSCDLRLCAPKAAVTLSEAKIGLCPATISQPVVREFGIPFAREAMLTARTITAAELLQRGLVARVGELDQLLPELLEMLKGVSSEASTMCKELVRTGWAYGGHSEQVAATKALFNQMMAPDSPGAWGVKQFQAGKKPNWDEYNGVSSKL